MLKGNKGYTYHSFANMLIYKSVNYFFSKNYKLIANSYIHR
ncbi:hypothetical protein KL86DYS1_11358 [uncultured Dysgonomonas sp.]|uniref:Uncharacterized protein n=1 Tax=uncultured Dysgonomonas sp. TaxID=206096 RepID=A0A212J7A7_9BACT|nr:hypothetical protein KL86DYS1_11358 [uncultured Dysgonomonas sp.]